MISVGARQCLDVSLLSVFHRGPVGLRKANGGLPGRRKEHELDSMAMEVQRALGELDTGWGHGWQERIMERS